MERGKREMMKVQCIEYGRRNAIRERVIEQEIRKILCPKYRTGHKKP